MRYFIIIFAVVITAPAMGFGGVYFLSDMKLRDVPEIEAFNYPIPTDANAIKRGEHIARTRGCFGCHGQDLQGKDFGEQWDWPERAVAPNLTTYARDHDEATMEAAIRQGIGADGRALMSMPSFNFVRLSDEDTAALIAFLQSEPVIESDLPEPKLGWAVRWGLVTGAETSIPDWVAAVPSLRVDAEADPARAHGEYLAMTMCNECHGLDLRGATQFPPPTPDLAMVAAYPREDFETLIYTGVAMGGRELRLMSLVAPDRYPSLTKQEIDDLYFYLQSLVDEPVPEKVFWRPVK